jgi:hypothetical protein
MRAACLLGMLYVAPLLITTAQAQTGRPVHPPHLRPTGTADFITFSEMNRTHKVGNVGLALSNWGRFGSFRRVGGLDYCTRGPSESFEYPLGSGVDYFGEGGIWIGAIKGTDTLVSTATDGWEAPTEFFPRPDPDGGFLERTTRLTLRAPPSSVRCFDILASEDAISEQDLITYYYDTVTSSQLVRNDPWDQRGHIPVGVEVEQKTYSWSFDYAKDFILMDLGIKNVSGDTLRDVYVGFFMDFTVGHYLFADRPSTDDMTGFLHSVPNQLVPGLLDTLNLAWAADANGDPLPIVGGFNNSAATGVMGFRLLNPPSPDLRYSYNWWTSNENAGRDWGPNRQDSKVVYFRRNRGTPLGDPARYLVMSNGELDWDQMESAMDHTADGWMEPAPLWRNNLSFEMAYGYDTKFLYSLGPFRLNPDTTIKLAFALVGGTDFHTEWWHFQRYFDPSDPTLFREHLNFDNLLRNARWASWVYDTPGFDTDGDGYRGEFHLLGRDTIFTKGDGIPDFAGPPPPPAPELRFKTSQGKIAVRWNGYRSETAIDNFSNTADFEGYRVYMSRTGLQEDFALLTQRDNTNYIRYQYRPSFDKWTVSSRPLTLDSLQSMYNDLVDSVYSFRPFHPDSFKVRLISHAMREIMLDDFDRSRLDTNYYVFEKYGNNDKVNDTAAATLSDCCSSDITGVIRKRYPFATIADTVYDDGMAYPAFYEYEYAIEDLQVAEPVFMSVTTFDFGDPPAGLSALESSPLANAREVWPINSAAVVDSTRPTPGVYPNPYRLLDNYNGDGWEDPRGQGLDPERARKITFTNVPETCTVFIYSLDGDLVRQLEHKANPASSEATVVVWNVITRNTQAVKTGIYIYAIESRYGTDVGKLVIIK